MDFTRLFSVLGRIPRGAIAFIIGFAHLLAFTISWVIFGDIAIKWFEEDIL